MSAVQQVRTLPVIRGFLTVLVLLVPFGTVQAHEVRPAIADLTTPDGRVSLVLRMSMEPVLAGIDLEGVEDTNETDRSDAVDQLRALSADAFKARIEAETGDVLDRVTIRVGATDVPLRVTEIQVDEIPDVSLPRESRLFLAGTLPDGAQALSVGWPSEYGTLILRQMDVDDGFTGYLTGGYSDPIAIEDSSGWGFLGGIFR
ncbi:Membrane protein [Mameliella alba]|uniref:Membrane protein n=1 Tax=Mameliella alba TaxID=561184 RepID=A0A0B3RT02_9RHOB|nr:Membrane protein [Mameliella alba]